MPIHPPAFLTRLAPFAATVLRLATGIVFIAHGVDKLQNGVGGFAAFLASLNVPLPEVMAWVVTALEIGGGILLILGLGTRIVALLFAIMMVFTIAMVKAGVGLLGDQGTGAEIDLMLLGASIALMFTGPGALAVDSALGMEPEYRVSAA